MLEDQEKDGKQEFLITGQIIKEEWLTSKEEDDELGRYLDVLAQIKEDKLDEIDRADGLCKEGGNGASSDVIQQRQEDRATMPVLALPSHSATFTKGTKEDVLKEEVKKRVRKKTDRRKEMEEQRKK